MADTEPTREIVTRKDAIARGLKHYFTGVPCRNFGHVDVRFLSNNSCYECLRVKKAKRKGLIPESERKPRKPRLVGEERRARINQLAKSRYWKNRDIIRAQAKGYYKNNAVKNREAAKLRHWANRDKRVQYLRERYRDNAEYYKKKAGEWRKANPHLVRVYANNRRSRKLNATGSHTDQDVQAILAMQRGKCAYCRMKLRKYQVDHIIALSKGGANDRSNLQILCVRCNRSKSNMDPIAFAQRLGKLL